MLFEESLGLVSTTVLMPDQKEQPTTTSDISYKMVLTAISFSLFSIAYYGITTEGRPWYVIASGLVTNFLINTFAAYSSLNHILELKQNKKYIALFATLVCALVLALPYGLISYLEAGTNNKIVQYGAPISSVLGSFVLNGLALKQFSDAHHKFKNYSGANDNAFTYLIKAVFAALPLYSALAVTCATDVSLQSDLGASPLLGMIGGNISMLGEDFLSITGGISIASELITVLSNLYKGEKISDQVTEQSVIAWSAATGIGFFSGYTAQKQLGECASSLMKPIGNFSGANMSANISSTFFNIRYAQYCLADIASFVRNKVPTEKSEPEGSTASMVTRYGAV